MYAKTDPELRGPQRRKLLRIPLFPFETRGLRRAFAQAQPRISDAPPVIVVPGLWASDQTMWLLRRYLTKCGYDAQGWGLGRNLAGRGWSGKISDLSEGWAKGERDRPHRGEANVPALCDQFASVVRRRSEALGRPIALVGWSLGGFLAREAARDYPDVGAGWMSIGSRSKQSNVTIHPFDAPLPPSIQNRMRLCIGAPQLIAGRPTPNIMKSAAPIRPLGFTPRHSKK